MEQLVSFPISVPVPQRKLFSLWADHLLKNDHHIEKVRVHKRVCDTSGGAGQRGGGKGRGSAATLPYVIPCTSTDAGQTSDSSDGVDEKRPGEIHAGKVHRQVNNHHTYILTVLALFIYNPYPRLVSVSRIIFIPHSLFDGRVRFLIFHFS